MPRSCLPASTVNDVWRGVCRQWREPCGNCEILARNAYGVWVVDCGLWIVDFGWVQGLATCFFPLASLAKAGAGSEQARGPGRCIPLLLYYYQA